MTAIKIIRVTPDNVEEAGIYCIKNQKSPGYKQKVQWFKKKINQGLTIQIAHIERGKQLGFIEYIPSELAWRPIEASNFLFIHCIGIFSLDARGENTGSTLIKVCEEDAVQQRRLGVCALTSEGAWMASKRIFEKNNFTLVDKMGRFDLMSKKFEKSTPNPRLIDSSKILRNYSGWHLVYSDQCPWHEKSVTTIQALARKHGLNLSITRLESPDEAKRSPSGFGTYALIKDGALVADHYLSERRFETILKQLN